jgi:hypothetical protein
LKFRTLGAVGYLAEGVLLIGSALVFVLTYFYTTTTPVPVSQVTNTSPWPGVAFAGAGEALTLVPLVLVSLAWFYGGKEGKSGIIRATGVLGFILVAAVLALSLWFFGTVAMILPSPPTSASYGTFFAIIFEFAIVAAAVGLIALAYIILEIITFFSGARVFRSGRFKWAAWGRIVSIIAVVVLYFAAIAFLISSIIPTGNYFYNSTRPGAPPSSQYPSQPSAVFGALFVAILLVLSVPNFFAFQGFRRIQTEPPPSPAWQASPAPQQ